MTDENNDLGEATQRVLLAWATADSDGLLPAPQREIADKGPDSKENIDHHTRKHLRPKGFIHKVGEIEEEDSNFGPTHIFDLTEAGREKADDLLTVNLQDDAVQARLENLEGQNEKLRQRVEKLEKQQDESAQDISRIKEKTNEEILPTLKKLANHIQGS